MVIFYPTLYGGDYVS